MKNIVIIILSIVVVVQFIVILFLIPQKTIEEVKEQSTSEWKNLSTYREN